MSWNKYVVGENGAEATPSSEEKPEVVRAQIHSQTEVSGGYEAVTVCVPAEMPPVVPVTGESFCKCPAQTELNSDNHINPNICICGEEEQGCDWVWDKESKSSGAYLSCSDRMVSFHSEYSCGTAAVRGSRALGDGQHFWEIKMTSPVYGTDMMVGIGTSEVNLDQFRHSFCGMLGTDEDSWGLSYTGQLHHKGSKVNFSSRFGQGSIIGVHLDTWHGTLSFYKNRRCIGVAATHLQNMRLYPMVCSTAAKSSMKLIRSHSTPTTLQYRCCTQLRNMLPDYADTLRMLLLPPGLRLLLFNQLGWVLSLGLGSYHSKEEFYCDSTSCLDDACHQDSASIMDVCCYHDTSTPFDHALVADHTSLCDPTHHHVSAVCQLCDTRLPHLCVNGPSSYPIPESCSLCPASSVPGHTTLLPDPTSDSESEQFFSDSETYQRKRCRWT
ncbi:SPRY domain-containing SOCS box protein 3 [Triplophysa tibetana]|uniref:SPRY domain-containing SOCS box protein 3 n=1 Tax=Triplophysa tibetana TaxID=1572043 RepID=A0A5A9N4Y5_9TELE|nr:SPRY domain-containing SOCS box protein 3 [Triplophysa tibetana]